MTSEEKKIKNIIDKIVVDCVNNEAHLLGKPKSLVTIDQLSDKRRYRERVLSRQICIYLCEFIFNDILRNNLSREYVGALYDKDHATVTHSLKTIKNYQDTSKQILRMTAHCIESVLMEIDNGEIFLSVGLPYCMLYPAYN